MLDAATCCPECAALSDRWHAYAIDYATRGNKRGCFANAGFEALDWSSKISRQLAANGNLSASIDHHRVRVQKAVEDEGKAHVRRIEARAAANLSTYVWVGNPNPEGLRKLFKVLTEGVEDRDSPGGQVWSPCGDVENTCAPGTRPPTQAELGKRILHAGCPTMPTFNDLSATELLGLDSFVQDRHGTIRITTTAKWASIELAKLCGLNAALEVDVAVKGETDALAAALSAACADLVAQWEAALECVDSAARQELEGVSEAIAGLEVAVLKGVVG